MSDPPFLVKKLCLEHQLALSTANMAVMVAAPVSMHSTMPTGPALSMFPSIDYIHSGIGYVRILFHVLSTHSFSPSSVP